MRKFSTLLPFLLLMNLYAATLVEYRMDECGWNGTTGEVFDSSGGGYDATAVNSANTLNATQAGGGLCRVGDMRGKYLKVESPYPALRSVWSMSLWLKFPLTPSAGQFTYRGYEYYIIATVAGRGDLGYFAKKGNSYKWGVYDNRGRIREVRIGTVSDGWHHVVQVVTGGRTYLYIDGSYVTRVNTYTSGDLLYVGSSTDSTNSETIGSLIDEFKIFDTALSAAEISSIYNNELNGLNYDGTNRICHGYTGPVTPLEFEAGEVTLKDTYADPTWTRVDFNSTFSDIPVIFMVIDNYGNNPANVKIKDISRTGFYAAIVEPQGEDGPHWSQKLSYFAINEGVHLLGSHYIEVGRVSTKMVQGKFASGTKGWTEVVPKVPFCNPAVVANIQTLNNEQGTLPTKPSTPWITAAVETNGSKIYFALDRSETSSGAVTLNETIGYMVAEADFTDFFMDDLNRTISYEVIKSDPFFVGWDNGCKRVAFRNSYARKPLVAGWKDSRFGIDGGWFRLCSLDSSGIGFVVDEDRAYDSERGHIEEVGAIFAFSDPFRIGGGTPPMQKNGIFNAVDYAPVCNAVLNWDDNITTKVTGSGFDLLILAKDADTNLPMEANITRVDLYRYASGDTSVCSGTPYAVTNICANGCGTTDAAGCLALRVPPSLSSKASRCVQVHIEGRDINSTLLDVNESNGSDNFALRPRFIEFLSPVADANLTAQEIYYYAGGVKAVMTDGTTAAADYNTTVTMQGIKLMRTGEVNSSLAGTLTAQPLNFGNGVADVNFSFSDVARLSLRIEDSSWASVDADDTPLERRVVVGERNVTFIPSHFDLQFISAPFIEDNDTVNRMTYISNDLNMSAWARRLSLVVTAKGKGGSTLLNFSNPMNRLFADPVDISVLLKLPAKSSSANTLFEPQPQIGADINFTSGEAVISYADVPFNYDRSYTAPVAPFFLAGSEGNISVAVTDASYRDVNGTIFSLFDGNATFYYGRVRVEDVATTELSTSGRVYFEVYDPAASPFVAGFTRSTLEWYINKKHDKRSLGRVVQALVKEGSLLGSATDSDISVAIGNYLPGSVELQLNGSVAARKSRVVHLDIDEWLWYAPQGFGSPYDFSASSDCISHPCFIYTLTPKGAPRGGVLSGEFGGSDFNTSTLDANATFEQKTGVKLFR